MNTATDNTLHVFDYPDNRFPQIDPAAVQRQVEMETLFRRLLAEQESKPFDETQDFRDFMVWLCGFVDRDALPGEKEWAKLQSKVKKIAAKFTTRSLNSVPQQYELPLGNTYTPPYVTTTTWTNSK